MGSEDRFSAAQPVIKWLEKAAWTEVEGFPGFFKCSSHSELSVHLNRLAEILMLSRCTVCKVTKALPLYDSGGPASVYVLQVDDNAKINGETAVPDTVIHLSSEPTYFGPTQVFIMGDKR